MRLPHVILRRLDDCFGQAFLESNTIELDPMAHRQNPLQVYLHEAIHLKHWDWSEEQVDAEADRIMAKMDVAEAAGLWRSIIRRATIADVEE